jgi:aminoglycoside phosphotransferase (APT) family kinase protein
VELEIAISRWLQDVDLPAVKALDVQQPVLTNGHVVSFWVSVSPETTYGTTSQLADLLRRLHRLETPSAIPLKHLEPFGRIETRLKGATFLDSSEAAFLTTYAGELASAYAELSFDLPYGVIHGDASVGNVLQTLDGQAVLSDLDDFAMGHREWDLVQTAMYFERYSWHTRAEYDAFVRGYGFDVMTWPGYRVLADVRELSMVAWLSQNDKSDEESAAELAKRIHALRTGGSRHDWSPL